MEIKKYWINPTAQMKDSKIGKGIKIYRNAEVTNCIIDDYSIVGDQSIVIDSKIKSNVSINRLNFILRSSIGKFTYTGRGTTILSATIGKFCSLSWFVSIGGRNHDFSHSANFPFYKFEMMLDGSVGRDNKELQKRLSNQKSCEIGNDVWIATNAIILRDLKIGNGAVIGAGAIVTKDVEPYSIVVGSPAKTLKMRFEPKIINALECISWWDWPDETIMTNKDLIYSKKVDENLIKKMEKIAADV